MLKGTMFVWPALGQKPISIQLKAHPAETFQFLLDENCMNINLNTVVLVRDIIAITNVEDS